MNDTERVLFLGEFKHSGPDFRRNFYFSESAWIVQPTYQSKFEKWPTLSSILANQSFSSKEISKNIAAVDKVELLKELNKI
jgi:hypothetical protein